MKRHNSVSENGKKEGKDDNGMATTALKEAAEYADVLMALEFRGRGDREKTCRHRLAKKIGVAESYLFRLIYKAHEMSDVKGEVYRRLCEAMKKYEALCEANENAADRYDAARMELLRGRNAADKEPDTSGR